MSNNNEEWRDELIDMQAKKLEKWGLQWNDDDWMDFISSQISQAEQRGMAAQQILFDRLKSWNNEWRAENPKERALKMEDSLKLIEWKIEKSEHRGRESMAEELEILKTMCEDLKRERDCAEKKLKKVLAWAREEKILRTDKGWICETLKDEKEVVNLSKRELRQILTGENN